MEMHRVPVPPQVLLQSRATGVPGRRCQGTRLRATEALQQRCARRMGWNTALKPRSRAETPHTQRAHTRGAPRWHLRPKALCQPRWKVSLAACLGQKDPCLASVPGCWEAGLGGCVCCWPRLVGAGLCGSICWSPKPAAGGEPPALAAAPPELCLRRACLWPAASPVNQLFLNLIRKTRCRLFKRPYSGHEY